MNRHLPKSLSKILSVLLLTLLHLSAFAENMVEKTKEISCSATCDPSTCSQLSTSGNPATSRLILLSIVSLMLTIFLYKKYKHKLFLAGGSLLTIGLLLVLFLSPFHGNEKIASCEIKINPEIGKISDTIAEEEFSGITDEFEQNKKSDTTLQAIDSQSKDEFTLVSGEFEPSTDEFTPKTDEFAPLESAGSISDLSEPTDAKPKTDYKLLYQLAVLFALLIIISYLIKYQSFRKTRGLFLLASVVYLGFYKGACPCMILSLHNTILAFLGEHVEWVSLVWFVGLIPLTYFFGKVWCGWLCHLGGLQELLFKSPNLDILKTRKAQDILRYSRIVLLGLLITQLFVTKTNIYIHYDPFKVAFNLFSASITGYVLLAILLVSSVLVYRPFCRAVCPVGLILGWVALIPGARQLSKKDTCIDCVSCSKSCQTKAMIYENKQSTLNTQDCILCGDCMGSCKKNSLYVVNFKR